MHKISLQKIYKKKTTPHSFIRGFSLIEILIAVAVLVSSLIFILPQINRSENHIKQSLRHLQALNRSLYSRSRIHNRVYRLVFHADGPRSSYWVEVKKALNEPKEKTEEDISLNAKAAPHPFFEKDRTLLKEPYIFTEEIQLHWPENKTKDSKTLHIVYHPYSFSHPVTLFIKKKEAEWKLVFNPLQGGLEISYDTSS